MKIKVKPDDVRITPGKPFEGDHLDREAAVTTFANHVKSVEGPCVFGVDADWGYGKSTFLRMLNQYLKDEGIAVVSFNAWEADYFADPLTAMSVELSQQLRTIKGDSDESIEGKIADFKKHTGEVLKTRTPAILAAAIADIPILGKPVGETIRAFAEHFANEQIEAYEKAKSAVADFKRTLGEVARSIFSPSGPEILVVTIDELDRCRPTYAVELLEVAKHLFNVEHVVLVLAVNRKELAHSINALYGDRFDAQGYLHRFIDVDFKLPDPDRSHFIDKAIQAVGFDLHPILAEIRETSNESNTLRQFLRIFLSDSAFSLRTALQCIHNLSLVYATLSGNRVALVTTTSILMIVKSLDRNLYYGFIDGSKSDAEVCEQVFELLQRDFQDTNEKATYAFEAWLIACHLERDFGEKWLTENFQETPLQEHYLKLKNESKEASSISVEQDRALKVLKLLDNIRYEDVPYPGVMFQAAVNRIELISDDFFIP